MKVLISINHAYFNKSVQFVILFIALIATFISAIPKVISFYIYIYIYRGNQADIIHFGNKFRIYALCFRLFH